MPISYLSDANIAQRVDAMAGLLDVLGNGVRNQLVHHLPEFRVSDVACNDFTHFLSDCSDL